MADYNFSMTDIMKKTIDKFFAEKTITDVDRSSYLVCNLDDPRYKIKISLVFMRDWNSIESDSYNSIIMENKGAIFTFPCYWISIPKELALPYFEYIIDDFYNNDVADWLRNSNNNEESNSTNTDCNCGNSCPVINNNV